MSINNTSGICNVFPIYELTLKHHWFIKSYRRINSELVIVDVAIQEIMSHAVRSARITLAPGRTFITYYTHNGTVCV